MNLNKAMIIGNLTRDPEVKTTPSGTSVVSFTVVTNFIWTDANGQRQERAEFHNVVAWRKLADICGQYLRKGSKVYIEGRLQTRSWDDQSGNKRYITEIIAENMIMLGSKGSSTGGGNFSAPAPQNSTEQPSAGNEPVIDAETPVGGDSVAEEEIKVENIPF